ncbi:hypothetical protein F8388_025939 [Cannabis sativa]|uniref:Mitogen-activated protein kinase n=1 Tax=Cannabis sativa TaxID=3483 RepID=A0A7J6EC49_CANSA|nr:hypothetical protein F8388_025939 [Cannabis sativa]
MVIISNSSRRSSVTMDKIKNLGFDPSLFVGAITSGELTHQYLQRRDDDWFAALGRSCIHMTWSDRGAISLEGLGLQVVDKVKDAEFILAHGTEALGHPSGVACPMKLEELESILEQCATKKIPMVVANPDFVTVEARALRVMPGTLAAKYEELGGEVKWMGKPDKIIYESAMAMAGVDASDSIAVGDSLHHDIKGANAAGIQSVFTTGGIHATELGLNCFGEIANSSSVQALASKYGAYPSYFPTEMDGAQPQPTDTVMSDAAHPEPQPQPHPPMGMDSIPATLSHGGRFIQYNIFGNIFEVTAKYKPPIMPIGKGAYGIVCSALNSETNESVAIKKIANAFDNKIDAKRTLREIKLLRHMDHENVVAIRDIIPPPQKEVFNDVYIAYELMDTDLHQIIRSNQTLSEEHCQILRGLKYIHSANVLHRDLKPSNLLLNANCDLKICDFGLARVTSETDFMTEYVVTRWYRAPELLLNSADYTAAIDVWSVGCIFMELMDRKPLFPGRDHVNQLNLLMELIGTPSEAELGFLNENAKRYIRSMTVQRRQSFTEKFPHVHPAAIDLVEKMLTFDPRQRITVEDALAHPYLTSLHDISDEPVCMTPFNFDFEQRALTEEQMKALIYQEAMAFNPEYQQ